MWRRLSWTVGELKQEEDLFFVRFLFWNFMAPTMAPTPERGWRQKQRGKQTTQTQKKNTRLVVVDHLIWSFGLNHYCEKKQSGQQVRTKQATTSNDSNRSGSREPFLFGIKHIVHAVAATFRGSAGHKWSALFDSESGEHRSNRATRIIDYLVYRVSSLIIR